MYPTISANNQGAKNQGSATISNAVAREVNPITSATILTAIVDIMRGRGARFAVNGSFDVRII